jgi:hypothetical protein
MSKIVVDEAALGNRGIGLDAGPKSPPTYNEQAKYWSPRLSRSMPIPIVMGLDAAWRRTYCYRPLWRVLELEVYMRLAESGVYLVSSFTIGIRSIVRRPANMGLYGEV